MRRLISITVLILLVLSSTASAFDGQRKGFVLGGGLGGAYGSCTSYRLISEGVGFAGLLMVGGGFKTERDIVAFTLSGTGHSDDPPYASVGQYFAGPVWFHYARPEGESFFAAFGPGMTFLRLEDQGNLHSDFGGFAGFGVLFRPRLQMGFYGVANLGLADDGKFGHRYLSWILSYMFY